MIEFVIVMLIAAICIGMENFDRRTGRRRDW